MATETLTRENIEQGFFTILKFYPFHDGREYGGTQADQLKEN